MASINNSSPPTAVVAGGGPAGALAAKVLSERGFYVHLYEAYPHPGRDGNDNKGDHASDSKPENNSRAYVISVNPRGQLALNRCGINPLIDLDAGVVNKAVIRHSNGKSRVKKIEDGQGSVMLPRRDLAASLLRAAEKSGAEVHCGWRLIDVNFEKKEVMLVKVKEGRTDEDEDNAATKEKTVRYDLLVGADGVRSQTRNRLSNYLNEIGIDFCVKTAEDNMEYQVATLPRPWKEIILAEKVNAPPLDTVSPASLHSFADTKTGSTGLCFPVRSKSSLSSISNNIDDESPIDKFLVCVIFPGGELGKMKRSGYPLGYESALSGLFANWTPESLSELARLLAEEDNVPNTGGVCIWSQALSHPESGVILVGDAGHGMWPSLGQGCNAALESVSVLADAIEAVDGSVSSGAGCRNIDFSTSSNKELVEAIALEYDGLRREDALAAVDLTFGGIGGTKKRAVVHSPVVFKFQIWIFMILHKVTGGLVPMPVMLRIMKGDCGRYSTLKWEMKVEKYVVYGIFIGILGFGLRGFGYVNNKE
mmetsp:Transcript_33205/g.71740  ORF Transcript_33205/g.71740 Transcript_33205/m.71740 type:complete len:536 (+) Transcript_33205:145-1752(+)